MTKGPLHTSLYLLGDLVQLRISLSDISRIAKEHIAVFPHLVVWLSIYIPKLLNIIREKKKNKSHDYYLPQGTSGKLISQQRIAVTYLF